MVSRSYNNYMNYSYIGPHMYIHVHVCVPGNTAAMTDSWGNVTGALCTISGRVGVVSSRGGVVSSKGGVVSALPRVAVMASTRYP